MVFYDPRALEPGAHTGVLHANQRARDRVELVGDGRTLDARLGAPRVIEMARDAGAKDFTVASGIRLRCAGEDASHLATKLADAAALYYTDFPDALADIELQERFAKALEVHRRRLTPANRSDLKEVLTNLGAKSAAGVAVAATVAVPVTTNTARSVDPVSSYRGPSPAGRLGAR